MMKEYGWAMALAFGLLLFGGYTAVQGLECDSCVYIPYVSKSAAATATPRATATLAPTPTQVSSATSTPAPPPPSYNNCQADPNAADAPNFPVRIVNIDKAAETVTLQNVSTTAVDLTGWRMCSINGNQRHTIGGTLAPGESHTFKHSGGNIWNNSSKDEGALYDPAGHLISYFFD